MLFQEYLWNASFIAEAPWKSAGNFCSTLHECIDSYWAWGSLGSVSVPQEFIIYPYSWLGGCPPFPGLVWRVTIIAAYSWEQVPISVET